MALGLQPALPGGLMQYATRSRRARVDSLWTLRFSLELGSAVTTRSGDGRQWQEVDAVLLLACHPLEHELYTGWLVQVAVDQNGAATFHPAGLIAAIRDGFRQPKARDSLRPPGIRQIPTIFPNSIEPRGTRTGATGLSFCRNGNRCSPETLPVRATTGGPGATKAP